jgi:hypothetical protein
MFLIHLVQAASWVVGVDAPTVAETLALSQSGDTLVIEGLWKECLDTGGRSLIITGNGILDGSGLCESTVRVASGEVVTIEGLTVLNREGRAFDLEWSTISLNRVLVAESGREDLQGGAIWGYGVELSTLDCVFSSNIASEGGAIYLYAYSHWTDHGSVFSSNTAAGTGGAVMGWYDNEMILDKTEFYWNSAGYYGGGIASWDYSDLTVESAVFARNSAPDTGGGALFFYPVDSSTGVLYVENSFFEENTAADGGALWVGWAGSTALSNNTFERNQASESGGAVLVYVSTEASLIGNTFCANEAIVGGGASVQWTAKDSWSNNVFLENEAYYGGGLQRASSYAGVLLQNSFIGNTASYGGGYLASGAYASWVNNLVAWSEGGGMYTEDAASGVSTSVQYSGFAANEPYEAFGYFWVEDEVDENIIAEDPYFKALKLDGLCGDDVRLMGESVFKDKGDPAILDRDGSRSDIGAWGGQAVEDRDGDGFFSDTDCDDTSGQRFPGAEEHCNQADDDCDGAVDEEALEAARWFEDQDEDGWGGAEIWSCEQPEGSVANDRDCDDTDPWINPEASDFPGDGIDANCSGFDNAQIILVEENGCQTAGKSGWYLLFALFAFRFRGSQASQKPPEPLLPVPHPESHQ